VSRMQALLVDHELAAVLRFLRRDAPEAAKRTLAYLMEVAQR